MKISGCTNPRVLPLEYCPSSIALFEYCPCMTSFFGAILEKFSSVIFFEYCLGGGNTRKKLAFYFNRVLPQGQYSKKLNSLFIEYCPRGNTRKKLTPYSSSIHRNRKTELPESEGDSRYQKIGKILYPGQVPPWTLKFSPGNDFDHFALGNNRKTLIRWNLTMTEDAEPVTGDPRWHNFCRGYPPWVYFSPVGSQLGT